MMAGEDGDDKKDLVDGVDLEDDEAEAAAGGGGNASDDEVYAAICDDGHEYTSKVRTDLFNVIHFHSPRDAD